MSIVNTLSTPPYQVPATLHQGHHYVTLKLAEKIIFKIPFNQYDKILDVGCRDGKITAMLASMNPDCEFTALTTSEDYFNQINQDKTVASFSNINFKMEDLYEFSTPNQFDKIVSFSCLTWFENKEKILANIYQSLRPGKTAYLQFFVDHRQDWFDDCRVKVASSPKWKMLFENFTLRRDHPTPAKIITIAENLGFIIEQSNLEKYKVPMMDDNYFKSWLKSISAHFLPRLQEKSDEFFTEVLQYYLMTHPKNADNQIIYEDYFLDLTLLKPRE